MYTFHFYLNGVALMRLLEMPVELQLNQSEFHLCSIVEQGDLTLHPAPIPINIPTAPVGQVSATNDEYVHIVALIRQIVEQLRDDPSLTVDKAAYEVIERATRHSELRYRTVVLVTLYTLGAKVATQQAAKIVCSYLACLSQEDTVALFKSIPPALPPLAIETRMRHASYSLLYIL